MVGAVKLRDPGDRVANSQPWDTLSDEPYNNLREHSLHISYILWLTIFRGVETKFR
jgi:hypothetical protein